MTRDFYTMNIQYIYKVMNRRRGFLKKISYLFLLIIFPLKIMVKKKGRIYWILKKRDQKMFVNDIPENFEADFILIGSGPASITLALKLIKIIKPRIN